ncbi:hypothetical protein QQ054_32635 [Oscillatoria amoena NRMC-F 0135]|nr:hypothetical protein [Oscillatoria amoena NRMC-F 0135]
MSQGDYIIVALCAIVGSFFATRASISIAHLARIHATPNDRTLHSGAIPRLGGAGIGFAFALALLVAWFLSRDAPILWTLLCLIPLILAGLYDDYVSSKGGDNHKWAALAKLAAQFAAALIAGFLIFQPESILLAKGWQIKIGFWGIPLVCLWLVAATNFFNFMDGANGLAGGTAVVVSLFAGVWNFQAGQTWAVVLCLVTGLAALGFLPFNFPRPKTFMGDCGSLALGFSLALVCLPAAQGMMQRQLNPWLLLLLWSPFLLDAGITLCRRLLRRENIFKAHNSHFYQTLIKAGHSHVEVSLLYWNLAVFFNLLALWLYR